MGGSTPRSRRELTPTRMDLSCCSKARPTSTPGTPYPASPPGDPASRERSPSRKEFFWATLHPAIVTAQGSTALSTLYRSLDGVTWHSEPQPCPSDSVASVAAATSARVVVVCAGGAAAGSQEKSAYVSNNDGASYQRVADPPFGGDFEAVAASPTDISVAASSGATGIDASFDGGRTWSTTLLIGDGGLGLSDLGFTTATQGVVIHGQTTYPASLQLLMTRHGGHEWEPVAVNPT